MNRNLAILGLILFSVLAFVPLAGASNWRFNINITANPYYYPTYVVYSAPVAFVPVYPVYAPVVYAPAYYTGYAYPSYVSYPYYSYYTYPSYIAYN